MIKLTRIKRSKRAMEWAKSKGERHVRIWSNQWKCYWCANRSGYTTEIYDAGVYTFADALDASGHCGAEKGIAYELVSNDIPLTQEPRGKAKLLLSSS